MLRFVGFILAEVIQFGLEILIFRKHEGDVESLKDARCGELVYGL